MAGWSADSPGATPKGAVTWPVTRFLQVRHRILQTPVIRYEHQKTGLAVTLVGTSHVGEAAYYERLHTMISAMEAEGALVHYEWIGPAAKQEWERASDAERAARDATARYGKDVFQPVLRHFGWVHQYTALHRSQSWRNVDMTDLEFVRSAGPSALLDWQDEADDMPGAPARHAEDAVWASCYALALRLEQFDWFGVLLRWMFLSSGANRRIARVAIKERNSRALAGLPPDKDVVLIWGAGHLPGLAAGLRREGYRQRDITWVRAGQLPSAWASIRTFWAVVGDYGRQRPAVLRHLAQPHGAGRHRAPPQPLGNAALAAGRHQHVRGLPQGLGATLRRPGEESAQTDRPRHDARRG